MKSNADIRKYVGRNSGPDAPFYQNFNKLVDGVRAALSETHKGDPGTLIRQAITYEGEDETYPAHDSNSKFFPVSFLKANFDRVEGDEDVKWDYATGNPNSDAKVLQINKSPWDITESTADTANYLFIPKGRIITCYYQHGYWYTNSALNYYVKTPVGGLPAKSGGVMGSAECEIIELDENGEDVETGMMAVIRNRYSDAVAGGKVIFTSPYGGHQVYENEDCNAG